MDLNSDSQLTLLVRKIALEDDGEAYKELFLSYYTRLSRFAYSICGNKESSEEIVSDVFMKIWSNRKSLLAIQNFHLYLYIATRNHSLNYLKKANRQIFFSLDEAVVEMESLYVNPEKLMLTAEMLKRIEAAVNGLPNRCRLIFRLVREDGLQYKEVAELLHLSVKTVENQMTIALSKIATSIQFDPKKFTLS